MTVTLNSRNALAPIIEVQDPSTGEVIVPARVDIRESIKISNLSNVREVQAVQGEGWGNLGLKYLGDARHWWVIAELSGVVDPFTELTTDRPLKVIDQETLFLDVLNGA